MDSSPSTPPPDKTESFLLACIYRKNVVSFLFFVFLFVSCLYCDDTCEWQAPKVSLFMMLHCFCAHASLYGLLAHGSLTASASGQVGDTFQLFPKVTWSMTTSWLLVVKSLLALPSKFPHRPHTFPCELRQNNNQNHILTTKTMMLLRIRIMINSFFILPISCPIKC